MDPRFANYEARIARLEAHLQITEPVTRVVVPPPSPEVVAKDTEEVAGGDEA